MTDEELENMSHLTHTYFINEIPDPFYSKYITMAGGDVLDAAGRDFEHLLRTLANLPPESMRMSIRFMFNPQDARGDNQSRLAIYLMVSARTEDVEECIRILLENGPITRFYSLERIGQEQMFSQDIKADCHIIREENIIKPLYGREFNINIPDYYYTIKPLKPDIGNDFMGLDRILNDISEGVVIDISVAPTDISDELAAHSHYLSRLQSINRKWDTDNDGIELQDFFGEDKFSIRSQWQENLQPLRYSDPLADDILRAQQRFHETLQSPHFLFQIKVGAKRPAVAQLIASVIAESAFEEGSYRLISCENDREPLNKLCNGSQELQHFTKPIPEDLIQARDPKFYSDFKRLASIATADELLGIFRLPVATINSPQCIRKNTDPRIRSIKDSIYWGLDQEGSNSPINMETSKCCKHIFVSGVPGSGKTTCIQHLMLQLHQQNIPFITFEPAKTEYRVLKTLKNAKDKNAQSLAKALEVYTLGAEDISPLRFNPLWIPPGISRDEHIDNLLACFLASMPVAEGPLPALLGEALERVYDDHPDNDDPPVMADLIGSVRQVLSEKGYSDDTNSDVLAALEVRLGMLTRRAVGKVFQCPHNSPSVDHLMNASSVLEFDRLYPTQACLIILFYLTSIREHLRTMQNPGKGPRLVIIIEEAHNIVGRAGNPGASSDTADPKSFAAEYICRMLAELRSLGVSIVIVDQLPTAIAPEVIKNTSAKLAFRQVAMEDREDLGNSMLFGDLEIEEIARFNTGEAFFYTEGFYRPRRIKTENLHDQFNFNVPVQDKKILTYIQNDPWFINTTTQRVAAELAQLKKSIDLFDKERLHINRELASLLAKQPQILGEPKQAKNIKMIRERGEEAHQLYKRLKHQYQNLMQNPFKQYLYEDSVETIQEPLVHALRENLVYRIRTVIQADVKQSLGILEAFIGRC